jgi:hypothetical protein
MQVTTPYQAIPLAQLEKSHLANARIMISPALPLLSDRPTLETRLRTSG